MIAAARGSAEPPSSAWPDLRFERSLIRNGCRFVAGLDEVGRGAWAGPLVAAAVVLPVEDARAIGLLDGVRDSKQLAPAARGALSARIREVGYVGIGWVAAEELDLIGVRAANELAMTRAIADLPCLADHLLVDAMRLPSSRLGQTSVIRGDSQCLSVAAASIVAKVTRDRYMALIDRIAPVYGFADHKGYGTAAHRRAIEEHGLSPHHRRSFAPIRAALAARSA